MARYVFTDVDEACKRLAAQFKANEAKFNATLEAIFKRTGETLPDHADSDSPSDELVLANRRNRPAALRLSNGNTDR